MKKAIGDNMILKEWGFDKGLALVKRAGYQGIELWLGATPWFQLGGDGSIASARVGVTGVAPSPFRAVQTEAALLGQLPTGPIVAAAAAHVVDGHADEINGDLHASSEYRAHVAQVLTRRALETARARADAA